MKFLAISQRKILGSSLLLPAYGLGGSRATPFLSAALFAKQKTKFGGGGKALLRLSASDGQARAGIHFPPTPFSARPSEFFSKVSVGIFAEKSSDFVQKSQQKNNFSSLRNSQLITCRKKTKLSTNF